jgi:hypothetical protein
MVIGNDAKFRPTVNNGEQTEMAVRGRLLASLVGQREAIEHLILQQ